MGLFGFGKSGFKTVKVSGSISPMFGKNVEQKKMEMIEEMENQGYTLVSCTGRQMDYGGGILGGLMGSDHLEYTLVFKKS